MQRNRERKLRLSYGDRIKKEEEEDQGLNKLWLIIRYLKVGELENHFVLRGGERIKIGRVVFTVRELVNDKYQYYGPDDLETGDSVAQVSVSGGESSSSYMSVTDDGKRLLSK